MGGLLNKTLDFIDMTHYYQYDSYDKNDCALASWGSTTKWPQMVEL